MDRESAFAGSFYPRGEKQLREMIEGYFSAAQKQLKEKQKTNCVVAPHAGYVYSGKTAAFSYSVLEKAKTFVILSPNHTGFGREISIFPDGAWETPLGKVKINEALSKKIAEELEIGFDETAHLNEHSIEVQLPFLQWLFKNGFDFVAITLATSNLQELKAVGNSIAAACKNEEIGVIASSDFTHFEPLENAKQKDLAAIKLIEKLDLEGFHKKVASESLSICGFAAITAAMQFCRETSKKTARLLHYDSSASATKDAASVVGYASIGFY